MKNKKIFSFYFVVVLLSLSHLSMTQTLSQPFALIRGEAVISESITIFAENNVKLLAQENISTEAFSNLFLVRSPATPERDFAQLEQYGKIIDHLPGSFALMYIQPGNLIKAAAWAHERSNACGSLFEVKQNAITPLTDKLSAPILSTEEKNETVLNLTQQITAEKIKGTVESLSSLHTRLYTSETGKETPHRLKDQYAALTKEKRSDVSIKLVPHLKWPQNSIIIRIEGKTRPDEVVVIGSHIDSINSSAGSSARSPGADDNASGTAVNMEVFRVLMENNFVPLRTIEIHGYAAEEVGLRGSLEIAADYRKNNINVVAMLQNDMNLYTADGATKIYLIKNGTSSTLNSHLEKLVTNYTNSPWAYANLFAGSSDHAAWTREGYHSVFPFENPSSYNRKIHTANDDLNNMSFEQSSSFAKLTLSFLAHFAGF